MTKTDSAQKPVPPKRALSAFFLYRQEVYAKVRDENPEAKITQITKIISNMWADVDPATKSRLEAEYQKNKEIAAIEKADYQKKFGKIEHKKKKVKKEAKSK